jgi:uncharacterized protein involved in propanediol utilization
MVSGVGSAGHHHGELLQGAVRRAGEVVSCLITLPVGGVGSRAGYVAEGALGASVPLVAVASGRVLALGGGAPAACPENLVEVVPVWKRKAARAAELALTFFGAPVGGRLEIECSVATGVGLGSSTCDVVAAIRAVCVAYGVEVGAADVARLAVEAEGAADPIMFDGEMVLFAQRRGRVLESFGAWVPPYVVLSIDTEPGGPGVDTLSLPAPGYTEADLDAFENMVGRARLAFQQREPAALAAVATESATLNQRFLSLRNFREIHDLAAEYHALGVQISHSGTVAGILFDSRPGLGPGDAAIDEVTARVRSLGARPRGLLRSGADDRLTVQGIRV